jgi:hypothetical protein
MTLLPIVQVIQRHLQRVSDILPLPRPARSPSPAPAEEHRKDVFGIVHAPFLQAIFAVLVVTLPLVGVGEDFVSLRGKKGEREGGSE